MKICSVLFVTLLQGLLTHGLKIKRDINFSDKAVVYENYVPTNLTEVVMDAINRKNGRLSLKKKLVDIKENPFKGAKYMKTPLETDPFFFNIFCEPANDPKCKDYATKVQEASEYISKVFDFFSPVTANVTIFQFCDYFEQSACKSIMGITYPPTFIPLREEDSDETFIYPQALVRQFELEDNIDYPSKSDFIVYLNSNYSPSSDKDNRSLIAAHEIFHGLGFFHQITPISVYSDGLINYKDYFSKDYAMPAIDFEQVGRSESYHYEGWVPFSIFDRYIVPTQNPDNYLYKSLKGYFDHNIKFDVDNTNSAANAQAFIEQVQEMEKDTALSKAGSEVAEYFTSLNAVGFHTKSGKVVELQTFDGNYESASSISHINVPFTCTSSNSCDTTGSSGITEDYLMYFTVIGSYSTDNLITYFSSKSKYDLISSNLVDIMTTLGWTEKNSTQSNDKKFVLSKSDVGKTDNESGSPITTHCYIATWIVVLLTIIYNSFF